MSEVLLDLWADELIEALVDDLAPQTVEQIAAAASASATGFLTGAAAPTLTTVKGAGLATAGSGLAGLSTMAKVGVTALAMLVGTGVVAVTGTLPDPVQSWIAGVAEEIGISLPTPDEPTLPAIPGDRVPLPDLPLGGGRFPTPDLSLEGDHIFILDPPVEELAGSDLPFDTSIPIPDPLRDGLTEPPTLSSDDEVDASVPNPTPPTVSLPQDPVTPPNLP
jgi:hypothetical protein